MPSLWLAYGGRLPVAPGDVVFGLFFPGIRKDRVGVANLHQFTQIHEGGVVRHSGGLLHIVGNDHDRVVALEFGDELFDLGGRYRIEGGGGFVQ